MTGGVKRLRLTRYEAPEAAVMEATEQVLALAKKRGLVSWFARMNTGAGRLAHPDPKRPGGWRVSQFMKFGFPGCPDWIGQMGGGGRFLAVECKRKSGAVSDDQEEFLRIVARAGGVAIVARDAKQLWDDLWAARGDL